MRPTRVTACCCRLLLLPQSGLQPLDDGNHLRVHLRCSICCNMHWVTYTGSALDLHWSSNLPSSGCENLPCKICLPTGSSLHCFILLHISPDSFAYSGSTTWSYDQTTGLHQVGCTAACTCGDEPAQLDALQRGQPRRQQRAHLGVLEKRRAVHGT